MTHSHALKKLNRTLKQVRSHADEMRALSDEALSGLTTEFKERLASGETLDHLLPESFAAICEADFRVLGKFPYDVQVLGAIALHEGCLAEMNTGEGKTLVATMPLYLNALTGKSTILMTTNEYLALRDAEEMGQVYRFMGLSVAAGVQKKAEEHFTNDEKKEIYAADIVYTTHGAFGFDYLLNNLVNSAEDRYLRELYYCIVDEADSVLLDAAQMPLVISGAPRVQSNLYALADFFVTTLREGVEYEREEKKVWLTDAGVKYAEAFFRIENFYGTEHFEVNRHVTLALRAHVLFEKGKDYLIAESGELQLIDSGSGRMMPGVKLRGGQHQAIEVKEGMEASRENRSMASITYQNLFHLFEKIGGMSGTIADAREELESVYGTRVVVIPPNCPLARIDQPDLYFTDRKTLLDAAILKAILAHMTGQPVLMVASTIAETEEISKLLIAHKIAHNVLNANNAFWEAGMIAEAGQRDAVTVATAMAGRGTDIKLGEGVRELGGLLVIGIGRMENVRQERQARGRAGRQGDPGCSQFFVSLEDDVVRRMGPSKIESILSGERKIGKQKRRRIIDAAQRTSEEFAYLSRKQACDYDEVMKRQRKLIYATRDALLDGGTLASEKIFALAEEVIDLSLQSKEPVTKERTNRFLLDHLSYRLDEGLSEEEYGDRDKVREYLLGRVEAGLSEQEERLGSKERMDDFVRMAALQSIDDAWVEQVDYLGQLQSAVMGRSQAQRNPVYEYEHEALASFRKMEVTIKQNVVRNILLSDVYTDSAGKLRVLLP